MDDKKFKKIYLISIVVAVILVLVASIYRKYNRPKPVYIDGVRTEIFGISDPEQQNQIRYKLLNEMKYGEGGIPQSHSVEIQKQLQEEMLKRSQGN